MDDLSQLITQLEHPDPGRRERALEQLRQRGAAALPLLRQALNVGLGATRPAAAEALVSLGGRAVECLEDALRDPEREVRIWAVWALKQIEAPSAALALLSALADTDSFVRRQAVDALGQREGAPVTEALCTALMDADSGVRQRAAELLGARGDLSAAAALCEGLRDNSTGVRRACCTALGALRAELGVSGLVERLEDPLIQVRKAAAHALGELHSVTAVRPLCRTLESLDLGLRDAAADALVEIGRRHTVASGFVAEVVINADATRQALAADILVRIGDDAIPDLCRLLGVMRSSARLTAARALRVLASQAPSPQLRAAIPVLKSELGPLSLHAEPTRDELRRTLRQIEAATKDLRHLPIPALPAARGGRELPVPAAAAELEAEGGRGESVSLEAQGGRARVAKQLVRVIRKLWRGR
jgi:HEAT repeat protein